MESFDHFVMTIGYLGGAIVVTFSFNVVISRTAFLSGHAISSGHFSLSVVCAPLLSSERLEANYLPVKRGYFL